MDACSMNFFQKIRKEFSSYRPQDRHFLFFVMAAALAINCEYGITRPASTGLFITVFSSKALPWVWLATLPLNLLVVWFYNRYLSLIGPLKMVGAVAFLTIAINAATAFILPHFPYWIFFQFAWKDIYVLLMFKQLWSMIHSSVTSSKAKYLYGLIYAMGTAGAVLGSLIPGFLAVEFGSEQLFLFTLPVYLFLFFCYRKAVQHTCSQGSGFIQELVDKERPKEGFSIVWRSPFLLSVLLLVLFMQIAVGLMEFQFNSHLELNILDTDLRTEYMGRMISLINLISGGLQIIGSFLIVHLLGIRRSHLAIPLILLANVVGFMAIPSFALISFAFVFTKAIDFSLFGVIREMLYIPLRTEEKFQAKAVIDVFVHRSAKALVSICIIGLQIFTGVQILSWIGPTTIAILVLWCAVVWFMLRKHYPSSIRA